MEDLKKTQPQESPVEEIHRIRITLTAKDVTSLEKVCSELVGGARERHVAVKGPVRMPTRTMRLTTRKSPCGEGTNTWDHFQMRVHKRVIDLRCTQEMVRQITAINIAKGVDIEVFVTN
ncbi:ribosomal protein S20 [Perkinsela sp. CCAP 1560/4]|nr:ribosomal protein S20 [Perkinsela sp. CCAP 1560/4]|eukprot:KNH07568.1 ribosomal protein S20 [Perkinsela sp. CCAP 1560/4]